MQNNAQSSLELYDVKTEELVFAFLCTNNERFDDISYILLPEAFLGDFHQEVYRAIHTLISIGKKAEPLSIQMQVVARKPEAAEWNIASFLMGIISYYIGSFAMYNLVEKANHLRNLYQKREAINAVQNFIPAIQNEETQPTIQALEEKLYHIMEASSSDGFATIGDIFSGIITKIEHIKEHGTRPSIDTGFHDINAKISGWSKGDLIILAGRPSMGKTALAIAMAMNSAKYLQKDGGAVAVFSLEMSAEQLVNRMIAVQTGVGGHKISSGMVTDGEFKTIVQSIEEFSQIPLIIDDTPAITIPDLRTKIRRMKRKHKIEFAVIDYLQLMRSSNKSKDNRVQEVSEITQNLKAIAREFKIPIVALSQLSRNVESREDKRPQLQDLRDSGSIEQDADIVMFLYRESYYLERTMPSQENLEAYNQWLEENSEKLSKIENLAEVIIAKHRNGPIGTALLRFDKDTTRFENLAKSGSF